jgi:hypothetical protein
MCRRVLRVTPVVYIESSYWKSRRITETSTTPQKNNVLIIMTSLIFILYLVATSLVKLFIHIFSIDIFQSFHEHLRKNLNRVQICR